MKDPTILMTPMGSYQSVLVNIIMTLVKRLGTIEIPHGEYFDTEELTMSLVISNDTKPGYMLLSLEPINERDQAMIDAMEKNDETPSVDPSSVH